MSNRITGDTHVEGRLSATSMVVPENSVTDASIPTSAAIQRTKCKLETKDYELALTGWRVHDDLTAPLPDTAAGDDLALASGTFGTDAPTVVTADVKSAGATSHYMRRLFLLPAEYEGGQNITLRIRAGMDSAVSDGTATIDVEVYKTDGFGGVGSDLVSTMAASINSLTPANLDFVITGASLNPGDELDIRITVAINDGSTSDPVIGMIGSTKMRVPIRG